MSSMLDMLFTQDTRPIAVSTPLGKNVLLLRSFEGREAISQLFSFELELLSTNQSINFQDIVGQRVSVRVSLADGTPRYWNGFVSRFTQAGRDGALAVYRATVVPWLWFLAQTTDCRIFQNKSAPDIITQLFQEYKFPDYSLRLGQYSPREYCVQYRETDLNFISRLMEEEGIFYFFEHEEDKHTLILCDDSQAKCQPCPHQARARCEATAGGWKDEDVIQQWLQAREYRPGVYTATDYNFETPTTSLLSTVNGQGEYEIYDFPGDYLKRTDGNTLTRMRLEEHQSSQTLGHGESNCRAFGVGYKFELEDHYRQDLNQEYVLTALHHSGRYSQDYGSGSGGAGAAEAAYHNRFECVPAETPIRPARRTPVPVVQGCQTAVVVGPAGEEIFTDKYGQVKVQFHWDREGSHNENSSCWMRVSQPWAGQGWGGVSIPRIGQEVLVDFLEGDPDRPLITGRVYNAAQMPPYELPAAAHMMGFKSNSTKGGGGYNEMVSMDTKGSEMVRIHSAKDMNTTVEHDDSQTVRNDRAITVDGVQNETVTKAVTEIYKANQKTTVTNQIEIASQTAFIHGTAATEIKLEVGASSLYLRADGYIELKGVTIVIDGSNSVTTHGNAVRSVADNEHIISGSTVVCDGSATTTVKGGMVMFNPCS